MNGLQAEEEFLLRIGRRRQRLRFGSTIHFLVEDLWDQVRQTRIFEAFQQSGVGFSVVRCDCICDLGGRIPLLVQAIEQAFQTVPIVQNPFRARICASSAAAISGKLTTSVGIIAGIHHTHICVSVKVLEKETTEFYLEEAGTGIWTLGLAMALESLAFVTWKCKMVPVATALERCNVKCS